MVYVYTKGTDTVRAGQGHDRSDRMVRGQRHASGGRGQQGIGKGASIRKEDGACR